MKFQRAECPRAKSDMTPCVVRDGKLACADDGVCVGCGAHPADLLQDLVPKRQAAGPSTLNPCCAVGCDREAEWTICAEKNWTDFTHACTAHVGVLLGDAPVHHIWRIEAEG